MPKYTVIVDIQKEYEVEAENESLAAYKAAYDPKDLGIELIHEATSVNKVFESVEIGD